MRRPRVAGHPITDLPRLIEREVIIVRALRIARQPAVMFRRQKRGLAGDPTRGTPRQRDLQ